MRHINVVAAVIEHQGRILAVQKGQTKHSYMDYKYEFPGGKIEPGETPEQALCRELLEEMDYPITVERHLITVEHTYQDVQVSLQAYLCHATSDQFTLREHVAYQWLTASTLDSVDWADADVDVVREVKCTSCHTERIQGEPPYVPVCFAGTCSTRQT